MGMAVEHFCHGVARFANRGRLHELSPLDVDAWAVSGHAAPLAHFSHLSPLHFSTPLLVSRLLP